MTASFYRAFEERYRGSRALVKQRQEAYLPFIQPLKELYPECPVLDIGCGRGEWLELMIEKGFQAKGVDLDEGMLASCIALGLPAKQGEALATLKALPENSQAVVTGFHFAEHIPFPVLKDIVAEVARVLRPAGLLILETPNAENLVVGTNNFYLDPTHERPIPHLLLSFLAEYCGFARTKLLRLQENLSEDLASIGLKSVLAGVSQDYAVIAQKEGEAESLSLFDPVFAKEYGVSLDFLAQQYDTRIRDAIQDIESRLGDRLTHDSSVSERLQQLQDGTARLDEGLQAKLESILDDRFLLVEQRLEEVKTSQLRLEQVGATNEAQLHELASFLAKMQADRKSSSYENQMNEGAQQDVETLGQKLENIQRQLDASLSNAHNWYLRAIALEEQVNALYASTSWRITAPMRLCARVFRSFARQPATASRYSYLRMKLAVYPWLLKAMRTIASNPKHKKKALTILQRYPRIYARLFKIASKEGMVGSASQVNQSRVVVAPPYNPHSFIQGVEPDLSDLSLHAREHYQTLKNVIQAQHKEPC